MCDSTYVLLQSVISQVHSLNATLNAHSPTVFSVSPYVLTRSLLEHAYKLAYLTDPHNEERLQRTLKLLYSDIKQYLILPKDLTSPAGRELAENQAKLAERWYCDLTGGKEKMRSVTAMEIFKAVGEETNEEKGNEDLITDGRGNLVPSVYSKGYRIYSAVSHGNLWAIQHYGVTKIRRDDGATMALPGLNTRSVYRLQEVAGGLLMFSLGFAVQFMRGYPPAGIMNELVAQIALIQMALLKELEETPLHNRESA